MRRLGLLGGMSWESSVVYERHINHEVRRTLGGVASADLIIRSFNFAEIESRQSRGDWDGAGWLLAQAAAELQSAGAEAIVLCTNTMHRVADAIEATIEVPLLHIVDATGAALIDGGSHKPLLLGTAYTMEQPFYRDALVQKFGVDVVIPDSTQRADVHRIIYDELVQGVISDASRRRLVDIVDSMAAAEGIDGVIAGCTEIELLLGPSDISVPYFPTTAIHATYAARWALAH